MLLDRIYSALSNAAVSPGEELGNINDIQIAQQDPSAKFQMHLTIIVSRNGAFSRSWRLQALLTV